MYKIQKWNLAELLLSIFQGEKLLRLHSRIVYCWCPFWSFPRVDFALFLCITCDTWSYLASPLPLLVTSSHYVSWRHLWMSPEGEEWVLESGSGLLCLRPLPPQCPLLRQSVGWASDGRCAAWRQRRPTAEQRQQPAAVQRQPLHRHRRPAWLCPCSARALFVGLCHLRYHCQGRLCSWKWWVEDIYILINHYLLYLWNKEIFKRSNESKPSPPLMNTQFLSENQSLV